MSRQQSDVVCISDSDGEGMDVDTAAGINRDTPPAATHIQPNTPRQAQKRTRTDGEAGDGNDGPVLIYLDDTPDKETARAKNAVVGKSALGISREIASYLCSSSCSLTELLTERFQKGGISSTYAESWSTILQRRFELPPWRSSTVIFTIMLSYWDALKQVFPRDLAGDIRRALPWVMFIENVPKCPQTKRPLTSDLHVSPFTYSKNSGPCTDLFKNEARQAGERKARTIELIHLARRILAQCELNETDAQERRRMQVTKEWAAWSKLNE
ncbi:hypothetical protein GGI12_005375 [Dipsacomyces acuminosporus]|nr:hypothetical protein GGI12_005375 [Dipsacomyces acuminosporus]